MGQAPFCGAPRLFLGLPPRYLSGVCGQIPRAMLTDVTVQRGETTDILQKVYSTTFLLCQGVRNWRDTAQRNQGSDCSCWTERRSYC